MTESVAALSPLDAVLRRHGATMVTRHGRCMAADFGSPTSEVAVCLSTVGIADRFDRSTFELCGEPQDIDGALLALRRIGDLAWWTSTKPRHALVRCEGFDAERCLAALESADGVLVLDVTTDYAPIALIGPRAEALLDMLEEELAELRPSILREGLTFELLIAAESGSALWTGLLEVGGPLRVACVGLDAIEHLAASQRVRRVAGRQVH
jgi:glycine cleavage system aminomethyltransferase T